MVKNQIDSYVGIIKTETITKLDVRLNHYYTMHDDKEASIRTCSKILHVWLWVQVDIFWLFAVILSLAFLVKTSS